MSIDCCAYIEGEIAEATRKGGGILLEQIAGGLTVVRTCKPIVHHITNYISINDCANITLAIGASPVMANDPAEVAEVVSQSAALVLNLGTPNTRMLESMLLAGRQANAMNIPVVLDPVGVGFTKVRTQTLEQLLLLVRPAVVRGNLAEIIRLAGLQSSMRGLDSLAETENCGEAVKMAARRLGCLVAATGETDYISDGRDVCRIENGDVLLCRITGAGCMTTSLVAACCGAMGTSLAAAAAGVLFMGIAGEKAKMTLQDVEGPGTFRMRLLDAVGNLSGRDIVSKGRCSFA